MDDLPKFTYSAVNGRVNYKIPQCKSQEWWGIVGNTLRNGLAHWLCCRLHRSGYAGTGSVYVNCLIRIVSMQIVWYEFNWIGQNGYFHVSPWGNSASDQERLSRLHQDPVKIPVRLRQGNQDPVEVLGQSRPSQATRASVKKHLMACVKWVCPAGCPWGRIAVVFISSEVWHDMFILKPVRRTIVHVQMQ